MRAEEMEKLLIADGWILKAQKGSRRHYIHPVKIGKVTIPFHKGDLDKGTVNAILKQAKLKDGVID